MSSAEAFVAEQIHALGGELRRRDLVLTRCYLGALTLTILLFLLPFHLARVGALLIALGLAHMLMRVYSARRRPAAQKPNVCPWAQEWARVRARVEVTLSPFYLLPLLVGANLVFMALPMAPEPVLEASLDCLFLGSTVLLFFVCYWLNVQAGLARLEKAEITSEA